MKRVLKWTVLVDDLMHPIGAGRVVLVSAPVNAEVCVWTEEHSANPPKRGAQVFGTGHPVPDNAHWVGSTVSPAGLVWHVYAGGAV